MADRYYLSKVCAKADPGPKRGVHQIDIPSFFVHNNELEIFVVVVPAGP